MSEHGYWWLDGERGRLEAEGWRTPAAWAQLDQPAPAEYEEDPR